VRGKSERPKGSLSARQLIEDHLPSFCWQTVPEILTMLEQVDDTVEITLVAKVVLMMLDTGRLERRCIRTPRRAGHVPEQMRGMRGYYTRYEYRLAALA
jgi:hypothetical protein